MSSEMSSWHFACVAFFAIRNQGAPTNPQPLHRRTWFFALMTMVMGSLGVGCGEAAASDFAFFQVTFLDTAIIRVKEGANTDGLKFKFSMVN